MGELGIVPFDGAADAAFVERELAERTLVGEPGAGGDEAGVVVGVGLGGEGEETGFNGGDAVEAPFFIGDAADLSPRERSVCPRFSVFPVFRTLGARSSRDGGASAASVIESY